MAKLIEPHTEAWAIEFSHLKEVLQEILNSFDIIIEHVGSTSIPGLCAKPILDIDIILEYKPQLTQIAKRLENAGYINKGEQGIEGRFAFRQAKETTPTTSSKKKWQEHHLYVCYSDSLALKNHLLFRDALLRDATLVEEYNQLKQALVKKIGITREEYTKQKTEFIIAVLANNGLNENELNKIILVNK